MTEVEKFIKKLHRLEKSGDLEVEHLLKALKIPDPALIEPLREMSRQYDWQPMNDDLVVPMAAWVDAICIYLESGVAGLIKAINRPKRFFRIVFGTIEELLPHTRPWMRFCSWERSSHAVSRLRKRALQSAISTRLRTLLAA